MRFESLKIAVNETPSFVSLDDAKAQLHIIDDEADNDKITSSINSAVAYCESYLWQSLRAQTIIASYSLDGRGYAELMRANLDEITSVKFIDKNKTAQNISIADIYVDDDDSPAIAYFNEPDASPDILNPVKITYKTKTPAVISEALTQAVLIAVSIFYDDRDAPDMSAVDKILTPYKTRYFI